MEAFVSIYDIFVEWHAVDVDILWFEVAIEVGRFLIVCRHVFACMEVGILEESWPEELYVFLHHGIVEREFLEEFAVFVHGVAEVVEQVHLAQSVVAVEGCAHVAPQFAHIVELWIFLYEFGIRGDGQELVSPVFVECAGSEYVEVFA